MSVARGGVSLSKPYPRKARIWKICSSVSGDSRAAVSKTAWQMFELEDIFGT